MTTTFGVVGAAGSVAASILSWLLSMEPMLRLGSLIVGILGGLVTLSYVGLGVAIRWRRLRRAKN